MELPARLRAALDGELAGADLSRLKEASAGLSRRYRTETRDGRLHLNADLVAKAYLAARLPATYAAVRASMADLEAALPGFEPATLLDVGSGPGTALFAAADCWPSLREATLFEASASIRAVGQRLIEAAVDAEARWIAGDLREALQREEIFPQATFDLVTLAYVLDELSDAMRPKVVDQLWRATGAVLLLVEPGTPAGWRRILEARERLIDAGAHVLAPCPHGATCPVREPDWCHFSRRVARSRLHRLTKGAEVPWEDEKFIHLAASRIPATHPADARVLAPPKSASGRIELKLCQAAGTLDTSLITRREGVRYKKARRLDWGDAIRGS